jgi:hypothetical protein
MSLTNPNLSSSINSYSGKSLALLQRSLSSQVPMTSESKINDGAQAEMPNEFFGGDELCCDLRYMNLIQRTYNSFASSQLW